jgi:hypothetical protein
MSERTRKRLRSIGAWWALSAVPVALYAVGLLVVGASAAEPQHTTIDGDTLLPLGLVAAGIGAVFYAGKQYQRLCDRLDAVEKKLERINCEECGK